MANKVTFRAGTGIVVTADASDKSLTIAANGTVPNNTTHLS